MHIKRLMTLKTFRCLLKCCTSIPCFLLPIFNSDVEVIYFLLYLNIILYVIDLPLAIIKQEIINISHHTQALALISLIMCQCQYIHYAIGPLFIDMGCAFLLHICQLMKSMNKCHDMRQKLKRMNKYFNLIVFPIKAIMYIVLIKISLYKLDIYYNVLISLVFCIHLYWNFIFFKKIISV